MSIPCFAGENQQSYARERVKKGKRWAKDEGKKEKSVKIA